MSTEADQPADDGADADAPTDPYGALMQAIRRAEQLDIPAGRGRAGWVLDQYREAMPGEGQVLFGGPYSAGQYRCNECGKEPSDHPGVRVLLPSDRGAGAAVLAGPFCPGCAVRRLNTELR